jgi:hypothetical protein
MNAAFYFFKMNRVLDTLEHHEFRCTPLECELYGDHPFKWEEPGEWEEMNDRHTLEELCDEGHCDVPFLEWLYL